MKGSKLGKLLIKYMDRKKMEDVIVQKLPKGQDPIRIKITQEQLENLKKGNQVRGTMLDIEENGHMNDKIFIMPHIETWELVTE